MDLTQLTPAALSELIQLVDKKQALLAQIEKLDASMAAIATGKIAAAPAAKAPRAAAAAKPAPKAAPTPKAAAPVRAKRGALKDGILAALAAAGSEGVAVTDLAAQLGVEPANVHVWFSTTGKKLSEITKVSAGRYALGAAATATTVVETLTDLVEATVTDVVETVLAEAPLAAEEPAASVIVEETVIVEEIPVAESTVEFEPEAAAPVFEEEAPAPTETDKRDELLLSSD